MDKLSILCLLLAVSMHCQADEETEVTGLVEETEVTGPTEDADEGQEQDDGEEQEEQGQEEEHEQDQQQSPALDQALGQVQVQEETTVQTEEPGQEQEEQDQEHELDQDQDQDVEKAEDLAQEQEEGEGQEQERRAKQASVEGHELVTDPEAIGGLDRLRQANKDSQSALDELDPTQTTSIPYDSTTISGTDDNFTNDDVDNTTTAENEGPTTPRTFIQLQQEPECLNEGGLCGLYETCPECMRGRPRLCPKAEAKRGTYRHQKIYDPRRDAAVCCFGMPVKETRCWKKKGVCINVHEYCPPQRLFVNASDCGEGKKCCMAVAAEQLLTIEY